MAQYLKVTNARLLIDHRHLVLSNDLSGINNPILIQENETAQVDLAAQGNLSLRLRDGKRMKSIYAEGIMHFNAKKISWPVCLRVRKPGDYIYLS